MPATSRFPRYKVKDSVIIEAIQRKDEPMSQMQITEFVPESHRVETDDTLEVDTQDWIWDVVNFGDFILKDKYGNLVVMDAETFLKGYEPI